MVGFVVRQMPFEQMQRAVDFLIELDFLKPSEGWRRCHRH